MARIRSDRVCFTINNYDESTPEKFLEYGTRNADNIQFMAVGQEIGANGTPHLQGFIHLRGKDPKQCGVKFWKAELPEGQKAHFSNARGTDEQNLEYCTKDGPYLLIGEPAEPENKYAKILEMAKQSLDEIQAIDPEFFIKNYNQLKNINDDYNKPKMTAELENLRDWQRQAIAKLEGQGDRQILFIVDEDGGKGKSALAKHLMTTYNSWACQGGKINDLMYAYDTNAEYVIFDMARCNNPDYYPWNFMENLKNGWFTSTKYKGGLKMFKAPKIIVFMNEEPPRNKLSSDRYNVFRI